MKIYKIDISHKQWGNNWDSQKIAARNFNEVVRKIKKTLGRNENIESVQVLASTN
jgi:hypothetical protein